MSICPKNKSSKGRRDKRRANWKMTAPTLVKCSKCGEWKPVHPMFFGKNSTKNGYYSICKDCRSKK